MVGLALVIGALVAGYLFSTGTPQPLWWPLLGTVVVVASLGGMMMAAPAQGLVSMVRRIARLTQQPRVDREVTMQLLGVVYELFMRARRGGMLILEPHVEKPFDSYIFKRYPLLLSSAPQAVEFLVGYLRMMVGGHMNSQDLAGLMDAELAARQQELEQEIRVMQLLAEMLPALAVVVVVLMLVVNVSTGVVAFWPQMVPALTVLLLALLFSHALVRPLRGLVQQRYEEEMGLLRTVQRTVRSYLDGYAPQVAVEFGRKGMLPTLTPQSEELHHYLQQMGLHTEVEEVA